MLDLKIKFVIVTYISWFSGLYLENYFMYKAVTLAGGIREPLLTCSSLFVTFCHVRRIYLKVFDKVSLSKYISLTTLQKAFIFGPWVPERVLFYAMSFGPRVHAPG